MSRIIVVAFGPRAVTRAAVDRLRVNGLPITVVPAIPSATKGLRSLRSPLVDTVDVTGRAGLSIALAPLSPDEPVLLAHDDVLLHRDAVDRLLRDVIADRLVVPASNQPDADGYVGVLPPDVLQPVGAGELEQIVSFRTSCVAATSSMIDRLIPNSPTSSTTQLSMPDGTALLDPAVVMTHIDSCRSRLEPPVGPDDRPLLVASMIVRDEEAFLDDCLRSLDGIVDRIDICDTGSTDKTVEIAEGHGANVIHREWRDDFGWARNEALAMSRDAWWVLQIDADERLVVDDVDAFRAALATAIPDREGFEVQMQDIDQDGQVARTYSLQRLFPGEGTSFVGRLHEVPHWNDGYGLVWGLRGDMSMQHYGYRGDVMSARDKESRNVDLARKMHEDQADANSALHLSRSLSSIPGRQQEVVDLLSPYVTDMDGMPKHFNVVGQTHAYTTYVQALQALDLDDQAWEVASEARRRLPGSVDLHALVTRMAVARGEFEGLVNDELQSAPGQAVKDLRAEVSIGLDRAQAHLALGRLDDALSLLLDLDLAALPAAFDRWVDLVSTIALAAGEDAAERLVELSAGDTSGNALRASLGLLDETDHGEFAVEVARHATATKGARFTALDIMLNADDGEAFSAFLREPGLPDGVDVRMTYLLAGPTCREVMAGTLDVDRELRDALATFLGSGDASPPLVTVLAEDPTGAALRAVLDGQPADVTRRLLVACFEGHTPGRPQLRRALAFAAAAGDDTVFEVIEPRLGELTAAELDRAAAAAQSRPGSTIATRLVQLTLGTADR